MKKILRCLAIYCGVFLCCGTLNAESCCEEGCGASYSYCDSRVYDCCDGCECFGCVEFNSKYSYRIMSHTDNLRKERILMHAKRCGDIEPCTLYTGFSVISIANYQRSNTESKFAYLMRHPTSSNQIGKDATEAVIHSAQLSFTAAVTDWLTGYGEYLYDPEQSFGKGTITDLSRNQVQLRKGYVMLGDLCCAPVYLAVGKMDTPFGQTFTVSPFTSNTTWHAFGGLAYGALAGYDYSGLNASFMAVQGGAQFRAHNDPIHKTNVPSRLTNYVLDANYSMELCGACVNVGGSYTKSSAYVQSFPVQHFGAGDRTNPAWSAYGQISLDCLLVKGSFAKTTKLWPGTHNPNAPLDRFAASDVMAFDFGGKWTFMECDCWQYSASAEFSRFESGAKDSPWERQNQSVFGLTALLNESSKFFAELIHTQGFVPLNFLSGGNVAVGETHSVLQAKGWAFVIGAQVTL